jgi:hypothetical protein
MGWEAFRGPHVTLNPIAGVERVIEEYRDH